MKTLGATSAMLRSRLGGMTKAQRTATLATLAGTDGVRTLTALYDAGPKVLAGYARGLGKQGSAAEVAAKKQANLAGKVEQLKGSFDTLKIVLGTALIPVLTVGAEKATGFVNAISQVAQGLTSGGIAGGVAQLDQALGGVVPVTRYYQELRAVTKDIDLAGMWQQAKAALAGFDLGGVAGQIGDTVGPLKTFADIAQWAFGLPGAKEALITLVGIGASFKVLNAATGGAAGGLLKLGGNTFRAGLATTALITQILAYKTARIGMTAADNVGTIATARNTAATVISSTASKAAGAATKGWAAAQWLLNAAWTASPIGVIVVGLALVAAGFVLAYRKIGWFRGGVQAVFGWLKDNWPLVLAILTGPVGLAVLAIVKNWATLKDAAGRAVGWVKDRFGDLLSFFSSLPGKLGRGAGDMFAFLRDSFKSAVNFIIRGWNGLDFKIPGFDPPGPGPKFGGVTIGVPDIPMLAEGGRIRRSGPVVVGDEGPEILSPRVGAQVAPLTRTEGSASSGIDEERLAALIGREVAAAVDGIRAVIGEEPLLRTTRRAGTRAALQRSTA
jgi:hypothetical protein